RAHVPRNIEPIRVFLRASAERAARRDYAPEKRLRAFRAVVTDEPARDCAIGAPYLGHVIDPVPVTGPPAVPGGASSAVGNTTASATIRSTTALAIAWQSASSAALSCACDASSANKLALMSAARADCESAMSTPYPLA